MYLSVCVWGGGGGGGRLTASFNTYIYIFAIYSILFMHKNITFFTLGFIELSKLQEIKFNLHTCINQNICSNLCIDPTDPTFLQHFIFILPDRPT